MRRNLAMAAVAAVVISVVATARAGRLRALIFPPLVHRSRVLRLAAIVVRAVARRWAETVVEAVLALVRRTPVRPCDDGKLIVGDDHHSCYSRPRPG